MKPGSSRCWCATGERRQAASGRPARRPRCASATAADRGSCRCTGPACHARRPRRVGVHRVVVDDVLRRAGVEFQDRRKLTVERMGGPLRGRRRDHRRDRRDLCCVARGGAASPQARWHRAATGNGSDAAAERRRRRRVLRRRTTVDRRHRETARSVAPACSRGRPVGGAADSVRPVNTGPQTVRPAIRRRRHDR